MLAASTRRTPRLTVSGAGARSRRCCLAVTWPIPAAAVRADDKKLGSNLSDKAREMVDKQTSLLLSRLSALGAGEKGSQSEYAPIRAPPPAEPEVALTPPLTPVAGLTQMKWQMPPESSPDTPAIPSAALAPKPADRHDSSAFLLD